MTEARDVGPRASSHAKELASNCARAPIWAAGQRRSAGPLAQGSLAGRENGWLASTTNMTNECRSVVPLLDTLHRRVGAGARLALAGTPVNVNGRKGCRFAGAGSYGGLLDGEALSPIVVAPTGFAS